MHELSKVTLWSKFEQAEALIYAKHPENKQSVIDLMKSIVAGGIVADTLSSADVSNMNSIIEKCSLHSA